MRSGTRTWIGWDRLALVAVLLTVAVAVGYVWLIGQQGDRPVAWFLGGLIGGALLGTYGAARAAPRRGAALTVSGVILLPLGALGIMTIGLPVLVAGVLALVAAARSRGRSESTSGPSPPRT